MIVTEANRIANIKEYYFVKKLQQVRQMQSDGLDVINFGIGSPDLSPPNEVLKALTEASERNIDGYQPYTGRKELREAMVQWYRRTYGVSLHSDTDILPLMGSKEGIMHLSMAFLNEGDQVLIPNPAYPAYTSVSKIVGADIVYYELSDETNWYPDLEALAKQDLTKVKMMWVNYPHMPTGTPPKKEVFEKLVAFAKEKEILICHDNPYSLVLNKQQPLSIFSVDGAFDVAVELNSLSKSHNMAGWRVGMLAGHKSYIESALKVKSNMDSGMYYGIQHAAIQALQTEETWHIQRNEIYTQRKKLVYKLLDILDCTYNQEQVGMFVWAKPKKQRDISQWLDQLLEQKHIFITPGKIFGSNGEDYIRLSLCVDKENIQKAIDRF